MDRNRNPAQNWNILHLKEERKKKKKKKRGWSNPTNHPVTIEPSYVQCSTSFGASPIFLDFALCCFCLCNRRQMPMEANHVTKNKTVIPIATAQDTFITRHPLWLLRNHRLNPVKPCSRICSRLNFTSVAVAPPALLSTAEAVKTMSP